MSRDYRNGGPLPFDRQKAELVQHELARILASRGFVRSERMIRFLRFAVESKIQGREELLKEHLIGIEVFDRKPAYDAGADPIVRVEARRLRSKLNDFYQEQGRNDLLRIDLPKGGYVPLFHWPSTPVPQVTEASISRAYPGKKAIAVLPFLNLTPDPANEHFSDGLTEELTNALARLKGMSVAARTSAFQFKGHGFDVRRLGELLNVQAVLEGSVRRSGKRLRIAVQLIDTLEGYHLWSGTYDCTMKDVFSLQEGISGSIVEALKQQLTFATDSCPRSE